MRGLVWIVLASTLGLFVAIGEKAEAISPSFACTAKASRVERAICSDPKLAAEDRLMARLYSLAQVSAFGKGPSNELAAQREWLHSRDYACGQSPAGETGQCLKRMYAEREERLAIALLYSNPEIALTELKRLDPEAAGLFEAIHLYGGSDKLSAAGRSRVVALLQPYARGTSRETDWGEPDARGAVGSNSAFAEFVGVRSAYLPGQAIGRVFPCAAIVRKPKLLDATGPRFGSNMDNLVIQNDCEDTLPPLPKFSALVQKRMDGMTDCGGGSIRFAYYRSFTNAASAARLATGSQLRKKPARAFPRRRNVTGADISAALDELAAYYVRYGRATQSTARPLARQMIFAILDEAWRC